jgi:hypothetical protein
MLLRKLIFLVLLILLTTTVSAVTITTQPDKLVFDNVLINGYSEQIIKVSSDRPEPVQVSLSATEPIDSWISFEPVSASVNKDSPAEFKVIIKPTSAQLGIYQGYIIANTLSEGNEFTTAVSTALDIETTIKFTDNEITQAEIENIVIKAEQNSPIKVLVTVQNQGNIEITPFFQIDLLNSDKSQVLSSMFSQEKLILPYSTDVIELSVPDNFALGTYWAQITLFLENEWVAGKQSIKFDVVKPGTLPKEELPVYKKEPIPLSMSPVIIIVWVLILIFIVWKISKVRYKK